MNPSPPRDLVITAAKANSPHFERCDKARGDTFSTCAECRAAFDTAHYALAAVLPAFEKQVRESIADDFEGGGVMTNAEMSEWSRLRDTDPDHETCLELWVRYSARIARGEA